MNRSSMTSMTSEQASRIIRTFAEQVPELSVAFKRLAYDMQQTLKPAMEQFSATCRVFVTGLRAGAAAGDSECIAFLREIGVEIDSSAVVDMTRR